MSAETALRQADELAPLVRIDQDQLFERLQNLRAILPVFATELADARRQAARLRVENRKLKEQLARVQEERRSSSLAAARKQLGSRFESRGSLVGPAEVSPSSK